MRIMMNNRDLTKKMIATLKEGQEKSITSKVQDLIIEQKNKKSSFIDEAKMLMEQASKKKLNEDDNTNNGESFALTKNTPQFGDIRSSQEESLIKTIGESIELDDNALMYYPQNKDLVLNGKVNSLNLKFQFRYNDPSGDGCYLWADALQLTDSNSRTLGKIRDAFMNWKSILLQNGDLMEKLHKASTRN